MTMIPGFNEPYPVRDAIVKESRLPTDTLVRWEEQSLLQRVNSTPFRVFAEADLIVNASTTGTLGGDAIAGLYRVTIYIEVLAADPVSSGLDVVIEWTHNGKALTRTVTLSGAPQTTNDTDGAVLVIETDPGTPISYALVYSSTTPGVASFQVSMLTELVNQQE